MSISTDLFAQLLPVIAVLCVFRILVSFYVELTTPRDPYERSHKPMGLGTFLYGLIALVCLIPTFFLWEVRKSLSIISLFLVAVVGAQIWVMRARKVRRICHQCSLPMRRIENPLEERPYLDARQQWEEHLKSADYDVWICPSGHVRSDLYADKKAVRYRMCPKCGTQAVEVLEIKNPRAKFKDSDHNREYPLDSTVGLLIMKCRACQHQYEESGHLTLHSGMFRRSKIPKRE